MTEIENAVRMYLFWLLLCTAFLGAEVGAFGSFAYMEMEGECLMATCFFGSGAIISGIIAFHYARIIKGMRLLEDWTWESERVWANFQTICATRWTRHASRGKPWPCRSFRRRS